MKEIIIFIIIFLIIFAFALIIFNGRFIYAQLKYSFLGSPPIHETHNMKHETGLPQRLVIPLIGVDAPVILPKSTDEYIVQKALERGVVIYPDSNVILGHSSAYPWYKGNYGSVFSLLNKLEIEDEILIISNGKQYVYQVLEKQIRLPNNLNLEKNKHESIIYLVSCWPINTNWKRIVIKTVYLFDPVRP